MIKHDSQPLLWTTKKLKRRNWPERDQPSCDIIGELGIFKANLFIIRSFNIQNNVW